MATIGSIPVRNRVWDVYMKRTDDEGEVVELAHHCRVDTLDAARRAARNSTKAGNREYAVKGAWSDTLPLV